MDRTVILAANRRARYALEVPAKPEPAEKTAGEELAHYIGKLGCSHGGRTSTGYTCAGRIPMSWTRRLSTETG